MKTKIGILVLVLCTTFFTAHAQRTVTSTRALSKDISDNLDLDAVASIFGDSENLEDFEHRLNDPDSRISNLDLNQDGYIDYLRVVENSSDQNSLVVIQAVLDKDIYQDVATIEIERVNNGTPRIQVVGDNYIYGSNYIIEPVYVRTPLIFSFFWGPRYVAWHSPYYWNYYPGWYRPFRPFSPFRYQRNVYVHINTHNRYVRTSNRNIYFSGDNYNHIRRNDYARQHPDRSFESRNQGLKNRQELNERRPNSSINRSSGNNYSRQYQDNRKSNPGNSERQRNTTTYKKSANSNQSGANQNRTRESNNIKQNSNKSKVQHNSDSGRRTYNKPGGSSGQPTSKSTNRTQNRVESNRKSPASSGYSRSGSNSNSRSNVKSNQKAENKSASTKSETKKESSERRRNR